MCLYKERLYNGHMLMEGGFSFALACFLLFGFAFVFRQGLDLAVSLTQPLFA